MADIKHRALQAKRMQFQFLMTELDEDDNPIKTVVVLLDAPDDITHVEVTEKFEGFLQACGYIFNGEIRYVSKDWEY